MFPKLAIFRVGTRIVARRSQVRKGNCINFGPEEQGKNNGESQVHIDQRSKVDWKR